MTRATARNVRICTAVAFLLITVILASSIVPNAHASSASITCTSGSTLVYGFTQCTVTITGTSPDGAISWSSTAPGGFYPPSCDSGSEIHHSTDVQCTVYYVPTTLDSPVTITASYAGDPNNQPASGTTTLSVTTSPTSALVNCFPSTAPVGFVATCTIFLSYNVFSIVNFPEAAPPLPTGTVQWSASGGAGAFNSTSCSVPPESCMVTFTPSSIASPVTITAAYQGNGFYQQSSSSYQLRVVAGRTVISTTPTATSTQPTATPTQTTPGGDGFNLPLTQLYEILVGVIIAIILIGLGFWKIIGKRKPPCTPEQIAAENAECDAEYLKQKFWVDKLEQQAKNGAKNLNRDIDSYNQKLQTFKAEFDAYDAELTQYIDATQPLGPPPKGNATWKAWEVKLNVTFRDLRSRLDDLKLELDRLQGLVAFEEGELLWYQNTLKSLEAELRAFLAKLKCIKCKKVNDLLARLLLLPKGWKIDKPNPPNLNLRGVPPAPSIPPEIPPNVPQGGGGGQNLQTQEKKKECKTKLEDNVRTDFQIEVHMFPFQVNPHPRSEDIGASKHFGKDYIIDECEANQAFIVMSASCYGKETHHLTVRSDAGGIPEEVELGTDLSCIDYDWKLDKATVTDSKYDAKDPDHEPPRFQLEGKDSLRAQKIDGSTVVIPVDIEKLYRDWEVSGDVPYFEGKFLDFELELTCTAKAHPTARIVMSGGTPQAGAAAQALPTQTKKVLIVAKGVKKGDKGNQTDDYDIQMTTNPNTPIMGLPGIENVSMAFSSGATLVAHNLKYQLPDVTFPSKTVSLMAGDYLLVSGQAIEKDSFDLTAVVPGCEPDTLHYEKTSFLGEQSAFTGYILEWEISSKSGDVDEEEWGSIGWDEHAVVLVAPDVDKDEDFEMKCNVLASWAAHSVTGEVKDTKTFSLTVKPYKNILDWFGQDKLHEKLVAAGIIKQGDGDKLKLYHPLEPELWTFVESGMNTIGMSVKWFRAANRYKNLFALAKEPIYPTFELSTVLPPEFAGIPQAEFALLHPAKRVTEPLVLAYRLGDLLLESTGQGYYYKGGTNATLEEAWEFYIREVYKKDPKNPKSPWVVPKDPKVLEKITGKVRLRRLQRTVSLRFNELCRVKTAYEQAWAKVNLEKRTKPIPEEYLTKARAKVQGIWEGKATLGSGEDAVSKVALEMWVEAESRAIYTPKLPIIGEPKVWVTNRPYFKDELPPVQLPIAGEPPPPPVPPSPYHEMIWQWKEGTKPGIELDMKMSHDVEAARLESGAFRVQKVNRVNSLLPSVPGFQRGGINEHLAEVAAQVGHPVAAYDGGAPRNIDEILAQMRKNIEAAEKGQPIVVRPAPALQNMETTFGRSIRLDTFKAWSMNTAIETVRASKVGAFWGAATYVLTGAFNDMRKAYVEGGEIAALEAFGKGIFWGTAFGALTGPVLTLAQKLILGASARGLAALEIVDGKIVSYLATKFFTFGGKAAGREVIEKGMIGTVYLAERAVFWGFRSFAYLAERAIPVVGTMLLIMDVTDAVSKGIGEAYVLWMTPDDLELGWKDRLRSIKQFEVDGIYYVARGTQITSKLDARSLPISSATIGAGSGIAGPAQPDLGVYTYMLQPRSTSIFSPKDNLRLEFGNEVVGPATEGLPEYMRDLLPPLPYENLDVPGLPPALLNKSDTEPYKVGRNQWYFLEMADKIFWDLQGKRGVWDVPVYGQAAEQERKNHMLRLWAGWRDRYATYWIRLTSTAPEPFVLFWWRDFNGKECTVMEHRGDIIMQPNIDLGAVIRDIEASESADKLGK